MLKTRVGEEIWLVHQPDHARVSGYLAAHWGGANGFARPGYYPGATHPPRWREEVILAIAEHDNGWWEWEAAPVIDGADGLPLGLADVARGSPDAGFTRWRLGVPRLAKEHPCAALLISLHAYWLYAFAFEDLAAGDEDALRHPLFGGRQKVIDLVVDRELTRQFLEEQQHIQRELTHRLQSDPIFAAALEPDHRNPHFKLLQVLDALSLLLAFNHQGEYALVDVPRSAWNDRVTLRLRRISNQQFACDPYPFDLDPLEVHLPARVVPLHDGRTMHSQDGPLSRLHAAPLETIRFELLSAR
jgi:hypothetical protein